MYRNIFWVPFFSGFLAKFLQIFDFKGRYLSVISSKNQFLTSKGPILYIDIFFICRKTNGIHKINNKIAMKFISILSRMHVYIGYYSTLSTQIILYLNFGRLSSWNFVHKKKTSKYYLNRMNGWILQNLHLFSFILYFLLAELVYITSCP